MKKCCNCQEEKDEKEYPTDSWECAMCYDCWDDLGGTHLSPHRDKKK